MENNIVKIKKIITKLLQIRYVEEEICSKYGVPGENQKMRCPVHLSIGQEGVAVAICSNLLKNELIFSNHRCHAHYLAKGGNLKKMIKEIYGKIGGCLDGRGGSMHLADHNAGVTMSLPIVASGIPIAAGSALADKINGNNRITTVFFGDGAVEEGVFYETMNFASLHSLPIIFVCEDNKYSIYTHVAERQPKRNLLELGKCHGILSYHLKTQDTFSLSKKCNEIISNCRKNSSPAFIVMDTYRYREHCGVNFDDHLRYRDKNEVQFWTDNDPVKLTCLVALEKKYITQSELDEATIIIKKEVEDAFEDAENAPLPVPSMARKFTYHE